MPEKKDIDSLFHDPLSEVTRKERRMLLIVSLVGIAITKAGLIPSQIKALGINFASSDQKSLYFLVSAIVIYFIIAFFIYSASDFLVLYRSYYEDRRREMIKSEMDKYEFEQRGLGGFTDPEMIEMEVDDKLLMSQLRIGKFSIHELTKPTILLRAFFEFILPIGVGIYSAYLLIAISLVPSAPSH